MMPNHFNSEYEILNWLSKHQNFAQGVAELRAASNNEQLTGGRGLVQKWLSVYDDVTTGREVTPSATSAPVLQPMRTVSPPAADEFSAETAAERRSDANAGRSITQESQLWAEAAREAAGRADLVAGRMQAPLKRARRWGKVGFVCGLLALLLVLLQSWLLWPQIEMRLRSVQQMAMPR
ncbi:MAG: hypothetical protein ABJB17_05300 [Burkholderiales bacterium]